MKLIFDLSANGLNCQVCEDKDWEGFYGPCANKDDIGKSMECSDQEYCLHVEAQCKYFFAITDRFNNLNPKKYLFFFNLWASSVWIIPKNLNCHTKTARFNFFEDCSFLHNES